MTLRRVAIVGFGETPFGKMPDRSITDIAAEACINAIKDAGVSQKRIGVATCGIAAQWNWSRGQYFGLPHIQMREIGITKVPIHRVEAGCATGAAAVRDVWYRIASGECDVGLAYGVEQMNVADSSSILSQVANHVPERDGEMGMTAPGIYGMMATRMMAQYGMTREHLAKVVVKNRAFGAKNPIAQFRKPVTVEETLNARMISDPMTLYMCCGRGDGAAALVMMDEQTARQYTSNPIFIAANVFTSAAYDDSQDFVSFDADVRAASQAYEMAGLGPRDLDFAEVHDSFATGEIVHYEDLGFCARGEGHHYLDAGKTQMGGDIVVNAGGGLLSKGHVIGATGVSQLCELVKQLRGIAGDRQIENAKVGLAHNSGGYTHNEFCAASISILHN